METRIKNLKTLIGCVTLSAFLLSCGSKSNDLTFEDFDRDGDEWVQKDEFKETFTENYAEDLNLTDDPGLDDEDFYRTTYYFIDINRDNMLSMDEWLHGYTYYYGDYLVEDFAIYDLNRDNLISYQEYYDGLYPTEFFHTWDRDYNSFLSDKELAEKVFESWDANNNGLMSEFEYQRFDEYYTDI